MSIEEDDDPWARSPSLVPDSFALPAPPQSEVFLLEPLDLRHNAADYQAWTSSVAHIRATPGFAGQTWPNPALSLEDNAVDLARHARHFARRIGFTYTVLGPESGDVIGCVYLYPARDEAHDVDVRSWVRADQGELDIPLHDLVLQWVTDAWPFRTPAYAAR